MADIFLSHSSDDNDAADRIASWLERDRESWSVFLDKHPRHGIGPGQGWQERLRGELQSCRVVLAIITPGWLASRWCFTEAVTATFQGKDFFGVLPDDLGDDELDVAPPIVHERQRQPIDLDTGAGWQELLVALDRSGLDPNRWFPIPGDIGPYPGFMAFEERDAGVFFGRDAEITEYLDALNLLRAPDRAQALVISGGSGSGKSSLLKAGLIPRLRQQSSWLIVPPFDPSREPIHALFSALRAAARETGSDVDLPQRPPRSVDDLATCLQDCLRALEEATSAWLLLPLDQAEVLLASSQGENESDASRLLAAVGRLLAGRTRKLIAMLTIRTEFLPALERGLPAGLRLYDRSLHALAALSDVIEKPAARFGIQFEQGLTGRMVEDTRGADALPLLAYTLRELYEKYGDDDLLTGAEYDQLGGVEGAIEKKLREALSDPEPSAEEWAAFRRGFVRQLVRVDEGAVEGERYLRTAVAREALPEAASRLVGRLQEARLLVAGDGGTIGIAHERLIRNWADVPLQTWLAEDSDDRRLLDTLRSFLAAHRDGGPLLTEKPLLDGRNFLERDPTLAEDEPDLGAFIRESVDADERRKRRQRWLYRGAIAASLVFAAVAAGAVVSFLEAREQTRIAVQRTDEAEYATLAADGARISALAQLPARATDALVGAIQLVAPIVDKRRDLPPQAVKGLTDAIAAVGYSVPRRHALTGHEGDVESITVSPDGRRFLSAGKDSSVLLWDAETLALLRSFERSDTQQSPGVGAASFSPDGSRVVIAGPKHALLVESATGEVVMELEGEEHDGVIFAGFSPDGTRIVTTGFGWLRLWDAASGDQIQHFDAHGAVLFAALSPDNEMLAHGGQRQSIVIQDLARGEKHVEEIGGGWFLTGAFSPSGKELLVRAESATLLWNVRRKEVIREGGENERVDAHTFAQGLVAIGSEIVELGRRPELVTKLPRTSGNSISFSALSGDGTLVVTLATDRVARVWNAQTGALLAILEGHTASVLSASFTPDGRRVVTASADGTARVWDLHRNLSRATIATGTSAIELVAASPNGQRVAGIDKDGVAVVWDVGGGGVARLDAKLRRWAPPVFSSDGARILGASMSDARMWETTTGKTLTVYRGHEGVVRCAALSPDGKLVVTGGSDKTVRLWDASTGAPRHVLTGHEGAVGSVHFSPDGGRIVSSTVGIGRDNDERALIWSADGGLLVELEGEVDEIETDAFSPDGSMIVGAGERGTATIWDAHTGKRLRELDTKRIGGFYARFSPDGSQIVTTGDGGAVQLWDAQTGAELVALRGDEGQPDEARFSPDGTRLLSHGGNQNLRLWDVASGDVLVEFDGQRNRAGQVTFLPDGTQIVAARHGGGLKIYPTTVQSFVSRGCDMLRHRDELEKVESACGGASR